MKTINKYFNPTAIFTVLTLLIAMNSCNENTIDSSKKSSNDFLFKVTVKNSAGAAVQGLRLSAYNDPAAIGFPKKFKTAKINSASSLKFALSKSSIVTLSIIELDGRILQQPIKNSLLNAGSYSVTINIMDKSAGTRVYKAVLTAKSDTTNVEFFKDSVYIALWQFDPSFSILGYTSTTGIFETTDSLSFPNVLTLPPIIRTTERDPTPVGMFTFPSDVVIVLYDSTTQKSQAYSQKVNKGKNEFELVWNPAGGGLIIEPLLKNTVTIAVPDTGINETIPKETRLYQNYPNPFN
jgi:hypothetical protein